MIDPRIYITILACCAAAYVLSITLVGTRWFWTVIAGSIIGACLTIIVWVVDWTWS